MSIQQGDHDEGDECSMAFAAALDVALEHCVDEAEMMSAMGKLLGIDADVDTDRVLDRGLTGDVCDSHSQFRQWVAARAIQIMRSQEMEFDEAMERAWSEAHDECGSSR